jgi:hypothetical protein
MDTSKRLPTLAGFAGPAPAYGNVVQFLKRRKVMGKK